MSEKNPLFSVVVPVYNNEKYLDECLSSLVNQTENDIEIILVDDGSTDSSGAICDEWALKDNRISVIHKENGGEVSAIRVGFELTKGKYFSKVDSDDWVSPNFYETFRNYMLNNDLDLLITNIIGFPNGKFISSGYVKDEVMSGRELIKTNKNVHTRNDACFSCRFGFKRSFMIDNKLFFGDCQTGNDTVLNLAALEAAERAMAVEYVGYHYRTNNNGVMRQKYKKNLENDIIVQYKTRKKCFSDIDSYVKDMSVYYVKSIFFAVLRNCINSPQGLRYKDVKRIVNSDWLVDSYKVLGFDLPFDSIKENIMAMVIKLRLAFIYYLYIKYKSK